MIARGIIYLTVSYLHLWLGSLRWTGEEYETHLTRYAFIYTGIALALDCLITLLKEAETGYRSSEWRQGLRAFSCWSASFGLLWGYSIIAQWPTPLSAPAVLLTPPLFLCGSLLAYRLAAPGAEANSAP